MLRRSRHSLATQNVQYTAQWNG